MIALDHRGESPESVLDEVETTILGSRDLFQAFNAKTSKELTLKVKKHPHQNQFILRIALDNTTGLKVGDKMDINIKSKRAALNPKSYKEGSSTLSELISGTRTIEVEVFKLGVTEANPVSVALSNMTSTASESSAPVSMSLGILAMFVSIDPNGVFMKFNQYLDLIKRLKYIGAFLGVDLEAFIESMSGRRKKREVTETSDNQRVLEVSVAENQREKVEGEESLSQNKVSSFEVSLFFEGPFMIKSILYDVSWLCKLLGMFIFYRMWIATKAVKWKLIFLKYQKKIHFIVFLSSISDILFFGTRIILHRRNSRTGLAVKSLCGANISLISIDLLEMLVVTLRTTYEPGEGDLPHKNKKSKMKAENVDFLNSSEKRPTKSPRNKFSSFSNRAQIRLNHNKSDKTIEGSSAKKPKRSVNLLNRMWRKPKKSSINLSRKFFKGWSKKNKKMNNNLNNHNKNSKKGSPKGSYPLSDSFNQTHRLKAVVSSFRGKYKRKSHRISLFDKKQTIDDEIQEVTQEKAIHHQLTLHYNRRNHEIENFAKSMIKNEPNSYTSSLSLLYNYFNVVHLALLQVLIPALPHSPVILVALLIAIEALFLLLTLIPYFTHSRFLNCFELFTKIFKFVFMMAFLVTCFIISYQSGGGRKLPISKNLQSFGIIAIVAGIIVYYLVTVVKIILMVVTATRSFLAKKSSKKEIDANKKEHCCPNQSFIEEKPEREGLIFYTKRRVEGSFYHPNLERRLERLGQMNPLMKTAKKTPFRFNYENQKVDKKIAANSGIQRENRIKIKRGMKSRFSHKKRKDSQLLQEPRESIASKPSSHNLNKNWLRRGQRLSKSPRKRLSQNSAFKSTGMASRQTDAKYRKNYGRRDRTRQRSFSPSKNSSKMQLLRLRNHPDVGDEFELDSSGFAESGDY